MTFSRHCALIWTHAPFRFSLLHAPLTNARGHRCYLQDCPPHGAPPARAQPLSSRHGLAKKLRFWGDLRQSPGTLGPLLGDHLATMGAHVKPRGAMQHPLGPSGAAYSSESAVFQHHWPAVSLFEVPCRRQWNVGKDCYVPPPPPFAIPPPRGGGPSLGPKSIENTTRQRRQRKSPRR